MEILEVIYSVKLFVILSVVIVILSVVVVILSVVEG